MAAETFAWRNEGVCTLRPCCPVSEPGVKALALTYIRSLDLAVYNLESCCESRVWKCPSAHVYWLICSQLRLTWELCT